jgi:hypothetical protein
MPLGPVYTTEEDLIIARAHIRVSENPRDGANQRQSSINAQLQELVWAAISSLSSIARRTGTAYHKRFQVISAAVRVFSNLVSQARSTRRSGARAEDDIQTACELYQRKLHKANVTTRRRLHLGRGVPAPEPFPFAKTAPFTFNFMACWEIMHHIARWAPRIEAPDVFDEPSTPAGSRAASRLTPTPSSSNHLNMHRDRPTGRDQSKRDGNQQAEVQSEESDIFTDATLARTDALLAAKASALEAMRFGMQVQLLGKVTLRPEHEAAITDRLYKELLGHDPPGGTTSTSDVPTEYTPARAITRVSVSGGTSTGDTDFVNMALFGENYAGSEDDAISPDSDFSLEEVLSTEVKGAQSARTGKSRALVLAGKKRGKPLSPMEEPQGKKACVELVSSPPKSSPISHTIDLVETSEIDRMTLIMGSPSPTVSTRLMVLDSQVSVENEPEEEDRLPAGAPAAEDNDSVGGGVAESSLVSPKPMNHFLSLASKGQEGGCGLDMLDYKWGVINSSHAFRNLQKLQTVLSTGKTRLSAGLFARFRSLNGKKCLVPSSFADALKEGEDLHEVAAQDYKNLLVRIVATPSKRSQTWGLEVLEGLILGIVLSVPCDAFVHLIFGVDQMRVKTRDYVEMNGLYLHKEDVERMSQ